jgi:UDP-N-acetylglucosamine 2-epimerase (non-hydrolysing)
MKVLTVFGTRPEIIRLSLISKLLDRSCEHITVHTGQNYDRNLSDIFFADLGIRLPDHSLEIRGNTFGEQVAGLFERSESVFDEVRPDRLLILGDTNSALVSVIAARRRIPVFHMEAGNRCFDDRVPEEVNRRLIDHSSTILLPYTSRSKDNLVREGIERDRIFVTGNPIFEILEHYSDRIDATDALEKNNVLPGRYFLATVHRAENVDDEATLRSIFDALALVAEEFKKPLLVSVHPRTAAKLSVFGVDVKSSDVRLLDPLPFFEFVKLEKNAFMVLTDSGTVQEECSIFRIPNITLRNVTERPETIECGSNILAGTRRETIVAASRVAADRKGTWEPPQEYQRSNVSETVRSIVLGFTSVRSHFS